MTAEKAEFPEGSSAFCRCLEELRVREESAWKIMLADSLTDETLTVLKDRLKRGVKATPLCLAVIGWLCETPTEPAIAEIRRNAEGLVWLRLSDETRMEPLCSFLDFLSQVRVICQSLSLTEAQTQQIIAWTRQRLG